MPNLTIRQFNAESGALLQNVSVINFGKVTAGTHSQVIVCDVSFSDITSVGNIKLGLISSGGLIVNTSPQDIASDGSAGNGYFGVESSADFDSVKASAPLSRHFAGINTTISAGDSNNVLIGSRTSTLSNYIYLDVELGAADIRAGQGAWKLFFDFS